jgi:hypothetical protein
VWVLVIRRVHGGAAQFVFIAFVAILFDDDDNKLKSNMLLLTDNISFSWKKTKVNAV